MATVSDAELRQIVLHECEHLRRYDDWLNLLQKLALALFPLNLALIWVDRRLGLERELACDAGVIAQTGAPLDYAACLARLAEHRMGRGRFVLALSAWARRSELARRVYTLLAPVRSVSRLGSRAALAGLACVIVIAAEGMTRVPHLVTFSSPVFSAAASPVPLPAESFGAKAVPVVFHPAVARAARRPVRVRAVQKRLPALIQPRMYSTIARTTRRPDGLVAVRISYSYAAVPFGDGWLIVQL